MEQCLTDYFDNHGPDWTVVVTIIADYPISNLRLACKIAKKYMNMDNKECESTFRHSRENFKLASYFNKEHCVVILLLSL